MNYFSIGYIREQLVSLGFDTADLYDNDLIEWIGSALMILENDCVYEKVVTNGEDGNPSPIQIINHNGDFPDDLVKLDLVVNKATGLALVEELSVVPAMYSDNFFKNDPNLVDTFSILYLGKSKKIQVSFDNGEVILTYRRFILDENGNVMIPDDQYIYRYVLYHCASMLATRYYIQGKVDYRMLDYLNSNYLFYTAAVGSKSKNLTRSKMEALRLKRGVIRSTFRYPTKKH
ncbi:MAG TPA: hypothetical protein PK222_00620 [Bacteroidales bacterium]|jgi:hypothetical protein|nr:hypothetical protein [Bacteroidales bacterium]HRT02686.1 hypothetical protein [Candidatus Diapherotrites archaeon]